MVEEQLDLDAFELRRMMRQQAHEKAFEIHVQAQRLFEHEKKKITTAGHDKLDFDYERKFSQLQQNQKIAASKKLAESRLIKMKARDACINMIKKETKDALLNPFAHNIGADEYRQTLKNLIIQGMIRLLEPEVELLVRECDIEITQGLVQECQDEYKHTMEDACAHRDGKFVTELKVITDTFLTPEQRGACGGVILMAHGRRIVVANTLEDRLALCFEKELPNIRQMLFKPKADGSL